MRLYYAGTFNRLHDGHKRILDEMMDEVDLLLDDSDPTMCILVTSDEMAQKARPGIPIEPWQVRADRIMEYCWMRGKNSEWNVEDILLILPMHSEDDRDKFLFYHDKVYFGAENEEKVGWMYLGCTLVPIPMVCDENGEEIHSTRIIEREGDDALFHLNHDVLSKDSKEIELQILEDIKRYNRRIDEEFARQVEELDKVAKDEVDPEKREKAQLEALLKAIRGGEE